MLDASSCWERSPCWKACWAMSDCARCLHRDEHGWWGAVPSDKVNDRGETVMVTPSHCGSVNVAGVLRDGCHRDWTGVREAHCPSCHRHFASNTAADHHNCSV